MSDRLVMIVERAHAIMQYGRVTKVADRSAALFRADLPDGAIYMVEIPLAAFAVWQGTMLHEVCAPPVRDYVHTRLVEQLVAEGVR